MTTDSKPNRKPKMIYVYALVDRAKFTRNHDLIKHALYIGKGTGSRMSEHMREVLRSLNCEIANDIEVKKRKVEELKELVINGRKIQAIRISAGYLSDEDAFRAEALAITLINSSRAAAGTKLLLNAVNGHHAQRVSDMQEHFLYTQADDELLPAKPDEYAILVKTTDKESVDSNWNRLKTPFIHKRKEVEKITVCSYKGEKRSRRAWDPLNPWSAEEAHARAHHYWPFKSSRVISWLSGDANRPTWLFAGVPDGKDTVVRYAWKIDWSKNWEFYPFEKGGVSGKWGVPVTDPKELFPHHLLGKRLVMKSKAGKTAQVLAGYSMGVRVIGIGDVKKK